jgi:UDP-glucuronate decarboxylase
LTRLLITGANGFIGRHVTELAATRGLEVHALTREPKDPVAGVTYHTADLVEATADACALVREIGATHLLHLAWYAVPRLFWDSLENYRWPGATMALASAFADGGGERVVAAGTCAEYDWTFGLCIEDATPLSPRKPYSVAKDATRRLLESWSRAKGISFAWGRLFFAYGPGEHRDRVLAMTIRSLLRGEQPKLSDGKHARDFLDVRDAAAAFLALLESDVEGGVNIASGEPMTLATLLTRASEELGQPLVLGQLDPPKEPPLVVADVKRLREEVGFTPRYDLDTGIRDAVAWHRSRLNEPSGEST